MTPSEKPPEPPPPPEIDRRLRLYPLQWIGIPILVLIPVLALFGVFGHTWAEVRAAGADVEMEVRYPSRFRYKELQAMYVRVRNRSDRMLDTVTVAFDTAYIDRFSTVTFKPDVGRAYEVELTDVMPGEERLITVEIQGEAYWRHGGTIKGWHSGADTARVRVSTFIFP